MGAAVVAHDQFFNWSLNQLSKEFGIARETVGSRIRQAGIQPSGKRNNYPVYRVCDVAEAILVPQTSLGGLTNNPEKMSPKERRDWYEGCNAKDKHDAHSGVTLSVEVHRERLSDSYKICLQAIETLPDTLERDFNFEPEIIEKVESRIDALRVDIYDKLTSRES